MPISVRGSVPDRACDACFAGSIPNRRYCCCLSRFVCGPMFRWGGGGKKNCFNSPCYPDFKRLPSPPLLRAGYFDQMCKQAASDTHADNIYLHPSDGVHFLMVEPDLAIPYLIVSHHVSHSSCNVQYQRNEIVRVSVTDTFSHRFPHFSQKKHVFGRVKPFPPHS